jgi:hypothetical protein
MNTPNINNKKTENNIHQLKHPWEKYLPGPQIRRILIIILIITVGYVSWKPVVSLIQKIRNNAIQSLVAIPKPVGGEKVMSELSIDKDTDGDGLADWQEALIGTDPNIPNAEDSIPQDVRYLVTSNAAKNAVTTEDKLALKIYQRLQTDPKGNNIEEAIQAATTKELLDLADSLEQQIIPYTLDDIEYSENNAELPYKNRMDSVRKIVILDDISIKAIYSSLFNGENNIQLTLFQEKINREIAELKTLPVPNDYIEGHLLLINNLRRMSEALSKSVFGPTDQTTKIALFLVFQKNYNSLINNYDTMQRMFVVN